MAITDLTNQVFGLLKVLKEDKERESKERKKNPDPQKWRNYWLCECLNCGKEVSVSTSNLTSGNTRSCGSCLKKQRRIKENKFEFHETYVVGYTDKGEQFFFDLEDYEEVSKHYWSFRNGYPKSVINKKNILLHRFVTKVDDSVQIDHENRNTADARKQNLRISTQAENNYNHSLRKDNTSGIIGVHFRKNKWKVEIRKEGERLYGTFDSFEEAVKYRLLKEKELFGEFAPQKHLFAQYGIED